MKLPEDENRTTASRRRMLTVSWNSHGFRVVTMLLPRASFNAVWFTDGNSVPLVETFFLAGWSAGGRKLVVYIDSALAHNSKMTQNLFGHNSLKRPQYLSYSLDMSPSDFHLFGKVKSALIGRETLDEIDLLESVTDILNGISGAELQSVFQGRIELGERVTDARGDYLTSEVFSYSLSHSRSTPLLAV
jgi:hypothetical protein